jgi:hypothetical protein
MKPGAALAVAVLVGLATLPARAQVPREGSLDPDATYRTPKHFAFELKFGPYTPRIDSEFAGQTGPYARYFGGKSGLMTRLELEYQVFQRFGSAAVGLGLGYFTKNGHSFPCMAGGGIDAPCQADYTVTSGDTTSLSLLPIELLGIYRFDVLALRYRIPVVPYGKIGLTYTFWWVTKGNGKVASVTNASGGSDNGRGGQFGLSFIGGVAFMLDALDPGSGRELDGALGINHTYLFWEWGWHGAEGLGASHPLKVGDSTWVAGLAFEF